MRLLHVHYRHMIVVCIKHNLLLDFNTEKNTNTAHLMRLYDHFIQNIIDFPEYCTIIVISDYYL